MMRQALEVLKMASESVPAVRYASGLAGVAAAASIVIYFLGSTKASIIILTLMFIGMILLFVFSSMVNAHNLHAKRAGAALVYATVVYFILFVGLGFSAAIGCIPRPVVMLLGLAQACELGDVSLEDSQQTVIDIKRIADFSMMKPSQDIVILTDTSIVKKGSLENYIALASPRPGQDVRLFDLNADSVEVFPYEVSCKACSEKKMYFKVPTIDGIARLKWEWKNAHGSCEEGLAFDSIYTIDNIEAEYILPKDVKINPTGASSGGNSLKCELYEQNSKCDNLKTKELVTIHWEWDMPGCKAG